MTTIIDHTTSCRPVFDRAIDTIKIIFLALMLLRLVWHIIDSFFWPMDGDISLLYYIAWLVNENDFVPYRDVHETSFFGTFVFYSLLTKSIGYSVAAFHVANIVFFALLSAITFVLLKPFGKVVALLAIATFGEFYFQAGPPVQLQRDVIALLPVASALWLAGATQITANRRLLIIGILFALASSIKPQFGAGLVLVALLVCLQAGASTVSFTRLFIRSLFVASIGFLLIWLINLAWLAHIGALQNFIDMVINYLPRYSLLNGRNYVRPAEEAWSGALQWFSGTLSLWLIPLSLSFYWALRKTQLGSAGKNFSLIILSMWLLYLAYVPMAGKYWGYHLMPSCYFLAMGLALMFCKPTTVDNASRKLFAIIFAFWLLAYWMAVLQKSILVRDVHQPARDVQTQTATEELAIFLKNNLHPGDRVQPHVTHTRGPIFPALLQAGAVPPTPYLLDYLFYHDVNQPFIIHARTRFMELLQAQPPRYIVSTPTVFFFRGENTETVFQPFEQWLSENYRVVFESTEQPGQSITESFTVYEYNGKK